MCAKAVCACASRRCSPRLQREQRRPACQMAPERGTAGSIGRWRARCSGISHSAGGAHALSMPCQCHVAAGRRARAPASSPASPSATAERINSSTYTGGACVCACVCVIRVRGTQARRHADHVDEERRLAAIQVVHAVACGSTVSGTRNTPVYRAHPRTHSPRTLAHTRRRCRWTRSHRPWPRAEYSRTACTTHSCGRFSARTVRHKPEAADQVREVADDRHRSLGHPCVPTAPPHGSRCCGASSRLFLVLMRD